MSEKGHRLTREIVIASIGSVVAAIIVDHFIGLGRALLFIWHLLTARVGVPVWLLSLLFITLALLFYLVGRNALRGLVLPFLAYREDVIFGIRWRWNYAGNQISGLRCYCPKCDTLLLYENGLEYSIGERFISNTIFTCEHCRWHSEKMPGKEEEVEDRVRRQIERKARSGEWKKQLEPKG